MPVDLDVAHGRIWRVEGVIVKPEWLSLLVDETAASDPGEMNILLARGRLRSQKA
jgi:hypothetical protein